MGRALLYRVLILMIIVAGGANGRYGPDLLPEGPSPAGRDARLTSCSDAIVAARQSPYWQNERFAVNCRPTLGGWRLAASATEPHAQCELYVGRDRLIVPRLPCRGVGDREYKLP